ncbi:hypothetical protein BC834DRAFT_631149 [Gloeopeniophorella convolvens]|nr:hypothetical protein BC834DRAFT_631149 [Gloeopeniophorella convolvens]
MKFATLLLAAVLPLAASAASVAPFPPTPGDCVAALKYAGTYRGGYSGACKNLVFQCMKDSNGTEYIWHKTSCVAAATCDGTVNLVTIAQCQNPAMKNVPMTQVPPLSTNVYANIAGSCASSGCPITWTRYVNWFYGELSNIGTPQGQYPDVNVVRNVWWQSILDWTKTGNSLPYKNFDDWLHYSNSS